MIYVITHKEFDDQILDSNYYKVLHVGKNTNCKSHYLRDDCGDSIAEKNNHFCEMTGLYWIWKNEEESADVISGLLHYRRYFTTAFQSFAYTYLHRMPRMLSWRKILETCDENTVILPTKVHSLDTVFNTYSRMHYGEDLQSCRRAIEQLCPAYEKSFDKIMNSHWASYGNMLICSKKILNEYCEWVFPILFKVDQELDYSKYESGYQERVIGFLAERLLDVWFEDGKYFVKRFPVFNTEMRGQTVFSLFCFRAQSLWKLLRGKSLRQ